MPQETLRIDIEGSGAVAGGRRTEGALDRVAAAAIRQEAAADRAGRGLGRTGLAADRAAIQLRRTASASSATRVELDGLHRVAIIGARGSDLAARNTAKLAGAATSATGALGGLRTILGPVGVALSLTGAVVGIRRLVSLGAEAEEARSKFETTFEDASGGLDRFLDDFSQLAGLDRTAAEGLAGTVGNIAIGLGVTSDAAARLSRDVLSLSGDLASFSNVAPERAVNALTSALVGEREALKNLGVVIREADVRERTLVEARLRGLDASSEAARLYATLAIAQERAGKATGDLERTQDSLANSQRRLGAQLRDMVRGLAELTRPAAGTIIRGLSNNFTAFSIVVRAAGAALAGAFATVGIGAALAGLARIRTALAITALFSGPAGLIGLAVAAGAALLLFARRAEAAVPAVERLGEAVIEVSDTRRGIAALRREMETASGQLQDVRNRIAEVEERRDSLLVQGGPSGGGGALSAELERLTRDAAALTGQLEAAELVYARLVSQDLRGRETQRLEASLTGLSVEDLEQQLRRAEASIAFHQQRVASAAEALAVEALEGDAATIRAALERARRARDEFIQEVPDRLSIQIDVSTPDFTEGLPDGLASVTSNLQRQFQATIDAVAASGLGTIRDAAISIPSLTVTDQTGRSLPFGIWLEAQLREGADLATLDLSGLTITGGEQLGNRINDEVAAAQRAAFERLKRQFAQERDRDRGPRDFLVSSGIGVLNAATSGGGGRAVGGSLGLGAGALLGSVIGPIGTSLGASLGSTLGGILGGLFGGESEAERERAALLVRNTEALDRLRDGLEDAARAVAQTPGEDLGAAIQAGQLAAGALEPSRFDRRQERLDYFDRALASAGITVDQLNMIAARFGITLNGSLQSYIDLGEALDAAREAAFQSAQAQFGFARQRLALQDIEDPGEQLAALTRQVGEQLSGELARLLAGGDFLGVFDRLAGGQFDDAELGGFSREQLLAIIIQLESLGDAAGDTTESLSQLGRSARVLNAPSGFRYAPDRLPPGRGGQGGGPGNGTSETTAAGDTYNFQPGAIVIQPQGPLNGEQVLDELERELVRRRSAGGYSRFDETADNF